MALRAPVLRVDQSALEFVVVTTARGDVRARRVIVAMMPRDVHRITFAPELPHGRRMLNEGWAGATGMRAQFVYDRPFWRDRGLNGQGFHGTPGLGFTMDNSPASGEAGVLLAFAEVQSLPSNPTARRERLVSQLVDLFYGRGARNVREYHELDWTEEAWTSGCVSPLRPGFITAWGSHLRTPVDRVHWAGTETAEVWNGYMDGAVRSGVRAAAEVLDALR